eukprot:NODE_1351_length_1167_cov_370.962230.p1 GENE.NODE_1351_length_1167_cov_370.962230~~NODE_1351_length_1167_cov_370.962230.p1  ORF type:complete len:186 (+),score=48.14 NODE_1351_length_1167_cov_370.962230:419-976(+)
MQRDKDYNHLEDASNRADVVEAMTEIFAEADSDESGTISIDELKAHAENELVHSCLRKVGLDLDTVSVDAIFASLDDGTGQLTLSTFIDGLTSFSGGARAFDLLLLDKRVKRMAADLASLCRAGRHSARGPSGVSWVMTDGTCASPTPICPTCHHMSLPDGMGMEVAPSDNNNADSDAWNYCMHV